MKRLFNKIKSVFNRSSVYEEALSRQEFFLMVTEHVLEQAMLAYPTKEHHEELLRTVSELHFEVHAEVSESMNYDEYKRQFRLQDLKAGNND